MKKGRRWFPVLLLTVILTGLAGPVAAVRAEDVTSIDTTSAEPSKSTEEEEEATKKAYEMTVASNEWDKWPEGPKTYGEAAIVMDAESGGILYAKNIDGKAYPASITKLLTTLIALENASLEDKITVTDEAVNSVLYGYAHIGLRPGEEISLKDALYAVLLASANEAAYAVGESVGEGYEWFIEQMNTRVKELGGKNSNFVNTNGMDDENHYTTARDMALITSELLVNHPEFEEISQTLQYTIPATNKESETRTFQQRHQMFYEGNEYYNAKVIAGKTGYTDLALNTLVTCEDDGNMKLVCVVLKTHGSNVYKDTQALFDYGFENFKKVSINENEKTEGIASIEENSYVVLPSDVKFDDLKMELMKDETNQNSGTVSYTYEGNPVGSAKVTLTETYAEKEDISNTIEKEESKETKKDSSLLKKIIIGVVLLIIFLIIMLFILRYIKKIQRKRRRKLRRQQRQREHGYTQRPNRQNDGSYNRNQDRRSGRRYSSGEHRRDYSRRNE